MAVGADMQGKNQHSHVESANNPRQPPHVLLQAAELAW
jgi:hypothetical protein